MIVPISQGAQDVFGDLPGGPDESSQLMAIARLRYTGELQAQSADRAPQSHKSTSDQLKGKVG